MNFIRSLNEGNLYFSKQSFQIKLLVSAIEVIGKHSKFELNISKTMPASPNTRSTNINLPIIFSFTNNILIS